MNTKWFRVADVDDLPAGRVRTVSAGRRSLVLTRVGDEYGALDNECPHQGGPLGEGSIEKGWLRCPWHGYDYDPLTGTPPSGFTDAPARFAVEVRADGIYVEVPDEEEHAPTVSDVMVATMIAWGVTHVFGMVGHSNLGFADAMRRQEEAGNLMFVGIRHEGAASFAASAYGKLTGKAAACFGIAGPGSTNLLTGLYDAKVDRAPVLAISGQVPSKVLGRGAFQDVDLTAAFADVASYSTTVLPESDHAELMNARTEARDRGPQRRPSRSSRRSASAGRARRSATVLTDRSNRRRPCDAARVISGGCARVARAGAPTRDRGRTWRTLRDVPGAHAGRCVGRAGAHNIQGEGPNLGPAPARRGRARAQRHARR
jgi:nitrite reductase/ring-hydroxylating ferredoxin subunit